MVLLVTILAIATALGVGNPEQEPRFKECLGSSADQYHIEHPCEKMTLIYPVKMRPLDPTGQDNVLQKCMLHHVNYWDSHKAVAIFLNSRSDSQKCGESFQPFFGCLECEDGVCPEENIYHIDKDPNSVYNSWM